MNKDYILFHLSEASEELSITIRELQNDPEYGIVEFRIAMEQLYNHINTAWNAREASEKRANECSAEDFSKWRQFPSDLDMSV
jgi:hypothetical protein